MTYPTQPINTPEQEAQFLSILVQRDREQKWGVCLAPLEKSRTNAQNALAAVIYAHVSKFEGDKTPLEIKCLLKYRIGVPIILAQEPELAKKFTTVLEGLTYEKRLEAMELIPLTSILKVKQFTEYLENIYNHYDPKGYQLPRPDDIYQQAMGRNSQ